LRLTFTAETGPIAAGVSAVEFALILPIFVGLMGAGIEISSLMIANMKVQRLATMTADMVAQADRRKAAYQKHRFMTYFPPWT
jgi:Flp pilus assembly protein TadG